MKHIKKKYLFQKKLDEKMTQMLANKGEKIEKSSNDLIRKSKEIDLFFTTDKDFLIKGFPFNYNGEIALIPIPDLSLVYFDSAYQLNRDRLSMQVKLFDKLVKQTEIGEDATNEIYRYYGYASSCIISLFTAIESYINHIIPNEKPYIKELKNKTEYYTKEQVQKGLSFDNKVKEVLPYFFDGKNFFRNSSLANQHITNLKNLRNEIVHPKSEASFRKQEELIQSLLNFKYEKTFEAVMKFMNYYQSDYIVECDCGVDF